MKKLPKRNKPTVAQYFQSESQRKNSSRLAFIYGHKRLVAVVSILFVASILTGLAIVQIQKNSKAASIRTDVSFTKASPLVDPGRWQTWEYGGANNGVFNKAALTMGFKTGYGYTQNYTLCYVMNPEGSANYPGLVYNSVTINYNSTERGTTQAFIGTNPNTPLVASDPSQHGGGASVPKSLSTGIGNLAPGQPVYFCYKKIAAGNNPFSFASQVQITDYAFNGAFDQPIAPPQEAAKTEVIGTVSDNFGKGVSGVTISNCQQNPAATTDVNGQYRFYVNQGSGFCVRLEGGISQFSRTEATNANKGAINVGRAADGKSYENQTASAARLTSYDFRLTHAQTPTERLCSNTGSGSQTMVEAEQASCKGTTIVADDGGASQGKAALLQSNNDYVEYTLKAPEAGEYQAVAKMRNQTSAQGKVNFRFIKLSSSASDYQEEDKTITSSSYANYTPRFAGNADSRIAPDARKLCLEAGQNTIVRVRVIGDPNVVVDQLLITKVSSTCSNQQTSAPTPPTPSPSPTTPAPTTPTPNPSPTPSIPPSSTIKQGDQAANVQGLSKMDENEWAGWGFSNKTGTNATIIHGKTYQNKPNFNVYTTFAATNYKNNTEACWVKSVKEGATITHVAGQFDNNDAGRNYVFFRGTGNSEAIMPRAAKGLYTWTIPNPIGAGGVIEFCTRVNNPDNKAFESPRTTRMLIYAFYGTGTRISDSTGPTVTIQQPVADTKVSGTFEMKAKATDPSGIQYIEFKQGGKVIAGPISAATADNVYSASINTKQLLDNKTVTEGKNTFTVLARDKAGNFASKDITLDVQKTAPSPNPGSSTPPTGTTPSTPTQPKPTGNTTITLPPRPDPIKRCTAQAPKAGELSQEAESAVCFPRLAIPVVQDRGRTVAQLTKNNQYVEYTFALNAGQQGKYQAQSIARRTADGSPVIQYEITKVGTGSSKTEARRLAVDYAVSEMGTPSKFMNIYESEIAAGVKLKVRVTLDLQTPKDEVLIDLIRLNKVADADPLPPTPSPSSTTQRPVSRSVQSVVRVVTVVSDGTQDPRGNCALYEGGGETTRSNCVRQGGEFNLINCIIGGNLVRLAPFACQKSKDSYAANAARIQREEAACQASFESAVAKAGNNTTIIKQLVQGRIDCLNRIDR